MAFITPEFLLTSLIVVIAPGTGTLYTIATGLAAGRGMSFAAAFGCTLGIIPHMLAAITGLAAILHSTPGAFEVGEVRRRRTTAVPRMGHPDPARQPERRRRQATQPAPGHQPRDSD